MILINTRPYASNTPPADGYGRNIALHGWFDLIKKIAEPRHATVEFRYHDGEAMTLSNISRRFFSQPIRRID